MMRYDKNILILIKINENDDRKNEEDSYFALIDLYCFSQNQIYMLCEVILSSCIHTQSNLPQNY